MVTVKKRVAERPSGARGRHGDRPTATPDRDPFASSYASGRVDHPVDDLLAREPSLLALEKRIGIQRRRATAQPSATAWRALDDALVDLRARERELAFNLGFRRGLTRGRVERPAGSLPKETPDERRLRRALAAAVTNAPLKPGPTSALLLEMALGLLRGIAR